MKGTPAGGLPLLALETTVDTVLEEGRLQAPPLIACGKGGRTSCLARRGPWGPSVRVGYTHSAPCALYPSKSGAPGDTELPSHAQPRGAAWLACWVLGSPSFHIRAPSSEEPGSWAGHGTCCRCSWVQVCLCLSGDSACQRRGDCPPHPQMSRAGCSFLGHWFMETTLKTMSF